MILPGIDGFEGPAENSETCGLKAASRVQPRRHAHRHARDHADLRKSAPGLVVAVADGDNHAVGTPRWRRCA